MREGEGEAETNETNSQKMFIIASALFLIYITAPSFERWFIKSVPIISKEHIGHANTHRTSEEIRARKKRGSERGNLRGGAHDGETVMLTTAVITAQRPARRRRLVVLAMIAVSVAAGVYSGYHGGRRDNLRDRRPNDVNGGIGEVKPAVHLQVVHVPREHRRQSAFARPSNPTPPPPSTSPPTPPPDPRWSWPKFFHQSYKNYDLSDNFKKWSSAVKAVNPDWLYVFWTDEVSPPSTPPPIFFTPLPKPRRRRRRRWRKGRGRARARAAWTYTHTAHRFLFFSPSWMKTTKPPRDVCDGIVSRM